MTIKTSALIAALAMATAGFAQSQSDFKGKYPETKKGSVTDEFFGRKVADPYRWLEDDRSAETADWVSRQNQVTQEYLRRIPFREDIKQRLKSLWDYEKFSAPFKEGAYTYYFKNDGLQNQSVLYRQQGNGAPEVFLDPNKFSTDGTVSLSGIEFSKDGSLAAYQTSDGGSDWTKITVMDAKTGKQTGEVLDDIKFSGVSWKGNEGFYYSSYDRPKDASVLSAMTDQHKLYYHKLGTRQTDDKLIFGGGKKTRRYVGGYVTEDQQYLIITAANATYGNELYVLDLTNPNAAIEPLVKGFKNEAEVVHAEKGMLYVLTNIDAPNRRLLLVDPRNPNLGGDALVIIPEGQFPLSVTAGGGKLFAQYIRDAVSQVYQYSLEGRMEEEIRLPGLGSAAGFSAKRNEKELFYSFTSYTFPTTIYRYEIESHRSTVYKQPAVRFDPNMFISRQVFYQSKDGTKVPMIITYRKDLELNGKNPLLLYGYGGFNVSLTPSFSVSNVVFMQSGGIYAVANLRGGGEYGDAWHNAGTKLQKQNVFDDFIAAAEYLIKEQYTSKEYLAFSGGSNGGLLVGAAITQRPDLFRVAFPAVGVMDMLRYHKFTAGAGWAYDYGTADDSKEMFDYLYKYSPVHNAKKACYPATMITTADHDDRVVPAHSFKFAAAMQAAQNCANPMLIRIETRAGHGAGKPTAMIIEEQADKWAFLFWNMGLSIRN